MTQELAWKWKPPHSKYVLNYGNTLKEMNFMHFLENLLIKGQTGMKQTRTYLGPWNRVCKVSIIIQHKLKEMSLLLL